MIIWKNKILRTLFLLIVLGGLLAQTDILGRFDKNSTARAFGDLTVDFHVPAGDPIFFVTNMMPGDVSSRPVDVTNSGSVARFVSVKGIRTGGVGEDPKLETVLDLVISDGSTPIYGNGSSTGAKTLADFFSESLDLNGVKLNIINSGGHKTYNFKVTLPSSSGNEFQAKSVIFDLTFGIITGNNLVINEVYYLVDKNHGSDSPKDVDRLCREDREDDDDHDNHNDRDDDDDDDDEDDDDEDDKDNDKDKDKKDDKKEKNNKKDKSHDKSKDKEECKKKSGKNDEWVEIYNPTSRDISLKNWTLTDNSGNQTIIHANKKVKAGRFALISKDASLWKFWDENKKAEKIELGRQIGDGLDNGGDRLILRNNKGEEVDRMSWGSDTSGFTPPAINPLVTLGSSTERLVPGFDTNQAPDWSEQTPPSPGS